MSTIRWIQFSDLHFNKTNINTRLLRDSIKSFLREKRIKCDYAFFAGDLRNAPDKYFLPNSVQYLRELCAAVEVSPECFFMVPGNHDIDRNIEQRDQAVKRILNNNGVEKGYYDIEEGKIQKTDLQDIKIGQTEFFKIVEEFYKDVPGRAEKYRELGHFLIKTEDFNIIHLDSTITYTKGQEESLVIGTDLLYDILEKVNPQKYTIILSHFPFDSLKSEEKNEVCRILEQFGVQLWMSGHLHDALVQMHRKAFHELQCGSLLTDGGTPNVLIGQLDTETGCGEIRAYIWQKNAGWILNEYLDRMSETDKSVYEFELRPTEVMKLSGKFHKKQEIDPETMRLIGSVVDRIEQTYEDRYTIIKDCTYGEITYPVVVKAWTPGDMNKIYAIEIIDRNTYNLEKMRKWIDKLSVSFRNYTKILDKKNVVAELYLISKDVCSNEQKERYSKDFYDICERIYRNHCFQVNIVEKGILENRKSGLQKDRVFISSISVVPVEKEMLYTMDIGIVAKVKASKPILLGEYDSVQEINAQINEYYQNVWTEWQQDISGHKEDPFILKRIAAQQEKEQISEGTLTDNLCYEITHNDAGLFSVIFDRYLYLGGVHGTPLRKCIVADLNTGVLLSLHEVLPMSFIELMTIIRERLYTEYSQDYNDVLEECYQNISNLYHQVDEFKFYIKYSSLYIYFDIYEISGYSMGYMDLYIMDLTDYLRNRYNIEECDIVRKQPLFEKIERETAR